MKAAPLALALLLLTCAAADLSVLPAHIRSDPFGQVVPADRSASIAPAKSIALESPRAAYVSCRILVSDPQPAAYTLTLAGPLTTELYREWFHFLPSRKLYSPTPLPSPPPTAARSPTPANRVPNQTTSPSGSTSGFRRTCAPAPTRSPPLSTRAA